MSLIGDRVDFSFIQVPNLSRTDVLVSVNEVEFNVNFGNPITDFARLDFDFVDDDTLNVTYTFLVNAVTVPSIDIIVSDLDWVDMPDASIINIISTGAPGLIPTFTADSITLAIPVQSGNAGDSVTFSYDIETDCFLPGTLIVTDKGEVAVEELKIGDCVETGDGQHVPVKWVGRQTVDPTRVKSPIRSFPVLVKAGALGHQQPSRDLFVSPNHSLLVDGLLINAGALVNHVSIIRTEPTETFVYYHIELEEHVLLIADGARAESYFPQKEDRRAYDNWAEYEALYPHGSKLMLWPLDYPRISSTNKVPRYVRKNLLEIARQLDGESALLTA